MREFRGRTAKPRLWTGNYSLTILSTLAFWTSNMYLWTVLPTYVEAKGGSEWAVGMVIGSFNLLPILLRPPLGRLVDRYGRRSLMLLGTLVAIGCSVAYVFAGSVAVLFALRTVHGLALAAFPTGAGALVADIAPADRRGEGLAGFNMLPSVAQMAAPAIGFQLAGALGYNAAFALSAATAAANLGIMAFVREATGFRSTRAIPRNSLSRKAVPIAALFLCVTIAFGAVNAFLPLLTDERGLGNPGLFFTMLGLFSVLAFPLAGRASDAWGRARVVLPGLLLTMGAMWMLAGASTRWMLVGAGSALGAGNGLAQTGLMALAIDRSPPDERGAATATFQWSWDIGGSAGGMLMGLVAASMSLDYVFWIVGAMSALGLLFFLRHMRSGQTAPRQGMGTETKGAME
ncbi:MAG: MFS transporter [Chloroflexi bacterium]|nr:MFS transporter [Chloroflexota bacterium]